MLQLFLTRSKIFDHTDAKGVNHRVAITRTTDGRPAPAPDWVAETVTYKMGVKDGSVRDLTPPTTKRVRRTKADDEPVSEPAPTPAPIDTTDTDVDDAAEETATATAKPATGKRGKAPAGSAMGLKG